MNNRFSVARCCCGCSTGFETAYLDDFEAPAIDPGWGIYNGILASQDNGKLLFGDLPSGNTTYTALRWQAVHAPTVRSFGWAFDVSLPGTNPEPRARFGYEVENPVHLSLTRMRLDVHWTRDGNVRYNVNYPNVSSAYSSIPWTVGDVMSFRWTIKDRVDDPATGFPTWTIELELDGVVQHTGSFGSGIQEDLFCNLRSFFFAFIVRDRFVNEDSVTVDNYEFFQT